MARAYCTLGTLALALAVAGCQFIPGSEAQQIEAAKKSVREQLVDGRSARFENVVAQSTTLVGGSLQPVKTPAVCGWVNSKNRMGAYAGPERFVVREGVLTFGDASDSEWSEAFTMCIVHSDSTQAQERLTREGQRAIERYADAVEKLAEEQE